jgi:hypothetical protein
MSILCYQQLRGISLPSLKTLFPISGLGNER